MGLENRDDFYCPHMKQYCEMYIDRCTLHSGRCDLVSREDVLDLLEKKKCTRDQCKADPYYEGRDDLAHELIGAIEKLKENK